MRLFSRHQNPPTGQTAPGCVWSGLREARCEGALGKLPRRLQSDSADVTERHTGGGGGGATVIQFKWASPPSSCEKLWFTVYFFFFFKTSFAAHLSAHATRRLLFTADIVSLSITPRPCLDPTTQWAAAAAPHSFISSPSPSRRQRNCCQQVTHSIKHPIRGYKQNTTYSLIAQAELSASQCYFFPSSRWRSRQTESQSEACLGLFL